MFSINLGLKHYNKFEENIKSSMTLNYFSFGNRSRNMRAHANIRQRYGCIISVPFLYSSLRYFSDFPRSHVELLDTYAKFQFATVISIHFVGILMLEVEAESQRVEKNPIISLAGCHVGAAVTRQVFSFIIYESGRLSSFQARPWDQTGFHRRGAVTEYTPKPAERGVFRV